MNIDELDFCNSFKFQLYNFLQETSVAELLVKGDNLSTIDVYSSELNDPNKVKLDVCFNDFMATPSLSVINYIQTHLPNAKYFIVKLLWVVDSKDYHVKIVARVDLHAVDPHPSKSRYLLDNPFFKAQRGFVKIVDAHRYNYWWKFSKGTIEETCLGEDCMHKTHTIYKPIDGDTPEPPILIPCSLEHHKFTE